jgi:hypothetical protein
MPQLTSADLEAFLDEPGHLLRIATVDDDGLPRSVPIWFIRQDNQIVFTPRARSVFYANIKRDPRAGLSIDEEALPYRKLSVQGSVITLYEPGQDGDWRDLYRQIAYRYVDKDAADSYVDTTINEPRALLAVPFTGSDVRVSTWRMPTGDEDPTGIWHSRYYVGR